MDDHCLRCFRHATVTFVFGCAAALAQAPGAGMPVPSSQSSASSSVAGTPTQTPDANAARPLPDIRELMLAVQENERTAEAIEKSYIFRSVTTEEQLDSSGRVKKITTTEADQFWLQGVPVRRVVRTNGKDLSTGELAKEDERIDKEVKDARERRAKQDGDGKETDPQGHEEITVSRLLALGSFSNPRRVNLNGRDTIAVDYVGDPHAKTHNRAEGAVREMAGTAWIDEQDRVLARVEGTFVHPFKVGAGLLVNVRQGTHFTFEQTKINDEVWLPLRIDAQGTARVLLFVSFTGRIHVADSEFRKFRTSTTILPAIKPEGSRPQP